MSSNFGYVKSTAGILKQISIGLVILVIILGYFAYFGSEYTNNRTAYAHLFTKNELRSLWREIYMLGACTLCFIFSSLNFIIHCSSVETYWNKKTAIIDFFYHVFAAILLGTSGLLFIVSAVKIFEFNCTTDNGCQRFEVKLAAGGFSMIAALIYGTIAVVVLTNRKDVERETLIPTLTPTEKTYDNVNNS